MKSTSPENGSAQVTLNHSETQSPLIKNIHLQTYTHRFCKYIKRTKMAPKKKHQQKHKPSSSSQSSSSSGPKLQISAENETRLRRLLLNSGRSAPSPADDSLSKAQKAKKLRTVYEKLSCEGFTDQQIELALSALKVTIYIFVDL